MKQLMNNCVHSMKFAYNQCTGKRNEDNTNPRAAIALYVVVVAQCGDVYSVTRSFFFFFFFLLPPVSSKPFFTGVFTLPIQLLSFLDNSTGLFLFCGTNHVFAHW